MYVQEYIEKIAKLTATIADESIRNIVEDILKKPRLSFTRAEPKIKIEDSPAAPRKHHMFTGGLAVHTYSVAKIALALCDIFAEVYGIPVNRDLVLAASVLHDIFKFYQYENDFKDGGYKARDDWYLSHDYAIVAELAVRGAKDELIRVVSEVHGLAPIKTLEGLIVHLADTIDAKFGEYLQNHVISHIKEIEQAGSKPFQILDELVKAFGVKMLGLSVGNRESLSKAVGDILLRLSEQKPADPKFDSQ